MIFGFVTIAVLRRAVGMSCGARKDFDPFTCWFSDVYVTFMLVSKSLL